MKNIAVLGSTGSIGEQTLEIVRQFPDKFQVSALAAGKQIQKLKNQIEEFKPSMISVQNESDALELKNQFPEIEIGFGREGNCLCASGIETNVVVVGIVGFAALCPTLAAIRAGKIVAIANKESIVTAGSFLESEIRKTTSKLIPVDSEHSALFQLLQHQNRQDIASLVLTASGGPFFRDPSINFDLVTPEQAVAHPNWSMGAKISVDSATLMNKGLELIEAAVLFNCKPSELEVWIHPQSIVHGALWFKDNSCITQLNKPDMRSSLGYALEYPHRLEQIIPKLKLSELRNLEFFEPDENRFPCLKLAREVLEYGPSYRTVLNAANEVAVHAFLKRKILFSSIPKVVGSVLDTHHETQIDSIDTIYQIDETTRARTEEIIASKFAV